MPKRIDEASRPPSVIEALGFSSVQPHIKHYGRAAVVAELRAIFQTMRVARRDGEAASGVWNADGLCDHLGTLLAQRFASRLRRVINPTGTVLHTNLGRAILPDEAVHASVLAMTSACNLEYDLDTGGRGDRAS
jgi:L-seryl-tRNA(Ser) seleniumtransferase